MSTMSKTRLRYGSVNGYWLATTIQQHTLQRPNDIQRI